MAEGVNIPVVVDIEQAFIDAAKRVKTAMKPLQEVIDSAPASLFIDVKIGKSKKVLIELFDDARTSTAQFQTALDQVEAKIAKLSAKGGFNLRGSGLTAEEKNLLEAASLLESKINGVGNASSSMSRVLVMNMKQAEAEVAKYMSQLDKLQVKQNLSRKKSPTSWELSKKLPYQKQIEDINLRLGETKSFLAQCSIELDRLSGKSKNASSSVGAIRTQSEMLAASFRRGHEYLMRWNSGLSESGSRMAALVKSSITLIGLHSATRFIQNVRNVTAEFELQRVALGGIIRDTERAESLFKQIKAAAIQSPFEIKDLVSFTKQLSAYRIETESLFDVTMRLADVSAGLGVDMSRLVLAYGQVRAAAVLRGQELRQFTEAGIPLVDELAEKFSELNRRTVKTAEVFDLISRRAVPFAMIKEIFEDMTNAGGIFYKMQEKQSETLKGQWMKLKDAVSIMYDEIGNMKTVHKALEDTFAVSMKLMQNWREIGHVLKVGVAALVAYKIALRNAAIAANALTLREAASVSALELNVVGRSKLIASLFGEAAATKVQIYLGNKYVRMKKREMVATNMFTKSLYKMAAAMLKNPYALAAAGIVALIAVIVNLAKKSKEAKISLEDFDKSISSFKKAESHAKDVDELCGKYDELANKEKRTAAETESLLRVSKELGALYPNMVNGIDSETNAVKLNTDAIRENNKAQREAIDLALGKDVSNAQEELDKRIEERDRLTKKLQTGKTGYWSMGGGTLNKSTWVEADLSESEKAAIGRRLVELGPEIDKWTAKVGEANLALSRFWDNYVDGPKAPPFLGDAWRTELTNYKYTLDGIEGTIRALTDVQIENFASQKDAIKYVTEEYDKETANVEFYNKALEKATGGRRDQTMKSLEEAQKRQAIFKQILDDWNQASKKEGNGSLAFLKEDLKNVQAIYKKYKEFVEYLGEEGAREKIKKIYGNVTAIDFLDPESYKKRLSEILGQIKSLQGQVKTYSHKFSAEMYSDLKNTIKKNEGLITTAYKLKGEEYPTVGWGFYKVLPDGKKVVEGMKMSEEEAEKYLDIYIQKFSSYVEELISKYGNGLQLTEKQFNVLFDLAYQGPGTLKRVLKDASGDINKLAELLKNAAWPDVADAQKAGVKKRDMRRYIAFMAGFKDSSTMEELSEAIFDTERIVQDVDWELLKDSLEGNIKKIAEDIKKSDVARNFYKSIFELTGDEELASSMAISVYGDIGGEFKDNIQKQLKAAAATLDASDLTEKLQEAIAAGDFETILKNIDKFPEEWQKRIKEMANSDQEFNAEQAKNLLKSLASAKTYSQKRVELARKTAERMSEIDAEKISEESKARLREQNLRKEADEEAKLIYEAFKDTPMYVEVFANLDAASSRMLKNMRENLSAMKDKWDKNLAPTELKELQSRLNELDRQLSSRNPFKALIASIREYNKLRNEKSRKEAEIEAVNATANANTQKKLLDIALERLETAKKEYGETSAEYYAELALLDVQKKETDQAIEQADAAQKTANKYREVGQSIQHAADELKKWSGYINTSLDGIGQIFKTFSSSDAGETFDILSEGVGKTLSGTADLAAGVGKILSGTDIVGGIVDVVNGAGDFISGVFGTSNRLKIKRINEQIEEQARLIKELEYSYNRLENALSKSFGSDYIANYNQQIATLQAQAEAYRNQAELEKDKGKKSDDDKVREYLNSAREVEAQIKDMENQLSEFFTETNLASAAKDFAQSWIEAYKEFGSTTDAIKQKFNDMIQNMVVNSLAAQLIQGILRPVFEAIDTASKDGALSAAEIAAISAMVPERMQMIDDSMQSLMNQLTSAGVNLRQQVGGFTGISRDIAGATEESINGLAAGINTQNFYMQHIDANVAAILATLTGGTTTAASGTTGEYVDPYKDTMLEYAQHIPGIHETLNSILSSLNSVIALNGTKKAIQVMM